MNVGEFEDIYGTFDYSEYPTFIKVSDAIGGTVTFDGVYFSLKWDMYMFIHQCLSAQQLSPCKFACFIDQYKCRTCNYVFPTVELRHRYPHICILFLDVPPYFFFYIATNLSNIKIILDQYKHVIFAHISSIFAFWGVLSLERNTIKLYQQFHAFLLFLFKNINSIAKFLFQQLEFDLYERFISKEF